MGDIMAIKCGINGVSKEIRTIRTPRYGVIKSIGSVYGRVNNVNKPITMTPYLSNISNIQALIARIYTIQVWKMDSANMPGTYIATLPFDTLNLGGLIPNSIPYAVRVNNREKNGIYSYAQGMDITSIIGYDKPNSIRIVPPIGYIISIAWRYFIRYRNGIEVEWSKSTLSGFLTSRLEKLTASKEYLKATINNSNHVSPHIAQSAVSYAMSPIYNNNQNKTQMSFAAGGVTYVAPGTGVIFYDVYDSANFNGTYVVNTMEVRW